MISALAVRWLAGLLLTLFLAASSYWAGDHNRNNAWLAKEAKTESDAHQKYVTEVLRGGAAASSYITAHQAMQTQFDQLTEKFNGLRKRVPLVVGVSSNGCTIPRGAGVSKPDAQGTDVVADSVLSAAAVWMWNSALTGTNQPSGACGADDTSTASCAAATSITVDDAWANHTSNAKLCAEDRLAHQRLIDFLNASPSQKPTPRNSP
jgi:hypothetical protein